jgi:hypothetical protein
MVALACSARVTHRVLRELGSDPNDEAPTEVIAFCPVCATRGFRMARKLAETYI